MKRILAIVFMAAVYVTCAAHAADASFGFKEYIIGKSKTELKFSRCIYAVAGRTDFENCSPLNLATTIAGIPGHINSIIFKNGKLIGIEVDVKASDSNMSAINSALADKFGNPLAEKSNDPVNHPTLVRWLSGGNQINSESYPDGIAAVIFFETALMQEFFDAQKQAALDAETKKLKPKDL